MATLATRISKFFTRHRPNRPVTIDMFSARRSSEQVVESLNDLVQPVESTPPRKSLITRLGEQMPGAKRDAAIAHLKQGYDEVVDLMRTVRGHLNDQSERSQKLLELLRHLPEAMQTLPETNRNQSRMLEVIQTHLDQQRSQSSRFNESMQAMARVTDQQNQIMGVIQQHMDASAQTDERLLGSFCAMTQTLDNLNDSTRISAANLRELNERAAENDRRTQQMVERTHRQMTVLSITSWVMAAIALGVAVYAVSMLG